MFIEKKIGIDCTCHTFININNRTTIDLRSFQLIFSNKNYNKKYLFKVQFNHTISFTNLIIQLRK